MPRGVLKTPLSAEQIRDTNQHASSVFSLEPGQKFVMAVHNGLDQDVSVQLYGGFDEDGNDWWPIGNALSVAAADDYGYAVWTEDWPYYKVIAQCSAAPTAGDVTVNVMRLS